MTSIIRWAVGVSLLSLAGACSNFIMNNDFGLSVRTMDLGPLPGLAFGVTTAPRSTPLVGRPTLASKYGSIQFVPTEAGVEVPGMATGGLNEAGLSCDMQTLITTRYPNRSGTAADLAASFFCEYALAMCGTAAELKTAIDTGAIHVHADAITTDQHFVARDAAGNSVVVEYVDGSPAVYVDLNDGGKTGWGVFTNEPTFDWQVKNVGHFMWKQSLARAATVIPGNFYPDERFLRIHLVKDAMPAPATYQQAVMQAVHTLNTVTVPMGSQMGTDSGAGEGAGDHTMWGAVYDHKNGTVYFRSKTNQNLQRLRIADLNLAPAAKPSFLPFDNELPWFVDAAKSMSPHGRRE